MRHNRRVDDEQPQPSEEKESLLHFADATHMLADSAVKFSSAVERIEERIDSGIGDIKRLVEEKENLRNLELRIEERSRKLRFRRTVATLVLGTLAVMAVVAAFSTILIRQNASAADQRQRIDGVLQYIVDCTTATPPAVPEDPHPHRHACYETQQSAGAKFIGELGYVDVFAVDCRGEGKSDGALVACVNDRLKERGFPPLG